MKKAKRILFALLLILPVALSCSLPAFAITEAEVKAAVDSQGGDAVTGNLFVWFLCAVAFLKVSQKIDSFISSLGISVGNTGGSMLAEAAITARSIGMVTKGFSSGKGSTGRQGSAGGATATGAAAMAGGLAGVVSRKVTQSAAAGATGQGGNIFSKKAFQSSMAKGGNFANKIIGSVAKGSVSHAGTISGGTAPEALASYMGYTGMKPEDMPKFSDVEIGGGRISGVETSAENPNGLQFAMYNAEQYTKPTGTYDTVKSVDGSQWYMQYAADAVKRDPYMTETGEVAYNESIIKKMPEMPKRKDFK